MSEWEKFVAKRSDLIEIYDDRSVFKSILPKSIDTYPLRSVLKGKLTELNFQFTNMDIDIGDWIYYVSHDYCQKLLNWTNSADEEANYDMTVDNISLFNQPGLFFTRRLKASTVSVAVSEAVWTLLMNTFGGGSRVRLIQTYSFRYIVVRVVSSKTGPRHCRSFLFSPKTTLFKAKKTICDAFGAPYAYTRWIDFHRDKPYAYLDSWNYFIHISKKQLLHENITYLDIINSNRQFNISTRPRKRGVKTTNIFMPFVESLFPEPSTISSVDDLEKRINFQHPSLLINFGKDSRKAVSIAINNEDNIDLQLKNKIIKALRDITTLEVYHKMAKFILLAVKDKCTEVKITKKIMFKETSCCLIKFSSLSRVVLSSLVDKFSSLERRVLKALETCKTLEEYESWHFLGETLTGRAEFEDFLCFTLKPSLTERIRFPFETEYFYSVTFKVRSVVLADHTERYTRQLYSVLLLDSDKVTFPRNKILHNNPESALANLSFYT